MQDLLVSSVAGAGGGGELKKEEAEDVQDEHVFKD